MEEKKLGLLAGEGEIPLFFLKKFPSPETVVVGIKGITSSSISSLASRLFWVGLTELTKCIDIFRKEGVKRVLLLGKFKKEYTYQNLSLGEGVRKFLDSLKDRRDSSFFYSFQEWLRKENIEVESIIHFLSPWLAQEGVLTTSSPSPEEWEDIEFGLGVAQELARLDIGQTVVVKEKACLALEAIEGTNETIRRGAKYGGEGVVVIKVARPWQDERFDVPVVGEETIELMGRLRARVLALEAKKVLLVGENPLKLANEKGISIVGIKPQRGR